MAFSSPSTPDVLPRLRTLLLLVITLGLAGTGAELVAIGHFEEVWQALPLGLIVVALAMVLWNAAAPSRGSVRLFQGLMSAFVVAGAIGIYLHYQGNLAFQLEIDPTQSHWTLFSKVIQAKAPPALAPGSMAQLGFLGLIWAYRHPAAAASSAGHFGGV